MIITGTAIMVQSGTDEAVERKLLAFPQVTYHGKSESGMDLIVNIEADDHNELETLCREIKDTIPEIMDIGHIYINFEEELEKIQSGTWSNYYTIPD
jgi:nitrate reductase NapAB chaperone NapD